MSRSSIESMKIRAKLLQKAKKRSGKEIPLKEALLIVAKALGYESWRELHENFEATDLFNPPHWSSHWKVWYNSLEEARGNLGEGYLLPYHKQFFVCDIHYIKTLGISEVDPDLSLIGNDWTIPQDKVAWERIIQKIKTTKKS